MVDTMRIHLTPPVQLVDRLRAAYPDADLQSVFVQALERDMIDADELSEITAESIQDASDPDR